MLSEEYENVDRFYETVTVVDVEYLLVRKSYLLYLVMYS